jgi:hypothetical protein
MKQVKLTEQILRLYYGRPFESTHPFFNIADIDEYWILCHKDKSVIITPHLRRLSSITEDELDKYVSISNNELDFFRKGGKENLKIETKALVIACSFSEQIKHSAFTPAEFLYLTSKGFDLFGLIEAGLAKEVSE